MPDRADDIEWLEAELDRLCERRSERGLSVAEDELYVVLAAMEADLVSPRG